MSVNKGKGKREWEWFPRWEMPSDPVKAVFWFMQWLLIVLVRYFWVPIIIMAIYECVINSAIGGIFYGFISGIITVLIGLIVWGILYALRVLIQVSTTVSRTISDINQMQQHFTERARNPYGPFTPFREPEQEERIIEGTVTNLEEERRKRRKEQ